VNPFALSWRFIKGGGRRGFLASGLTLAAVAVASGLLLFAVSANHAFARRATADAWRYPEKSGHPSAVEALTTDYVRGKPMAVVDLAALTPGAPVPPGMKRFPRPGEVWVSPALKRLLGRLPADELAGRFPGPVTGVLGQRGVVHPGELVAVVGRTPADPAMKASRDGGGDKSGVGIARYQSSSSDSVTFAYQILAAVATVLMVAPLLIFGGAAARLTVARRDQRLAALRLIGATPGQVVGITVAEAVVTAFAGAAAGVVLYAIAAPALTQLSIGGGTWYLSDLWMGLPLLAAVLAGVPLLVGISAVVGLRRVVVSPLGVAKRETPPGMRAIRLVVFLAVLVAFAVLAADGFGNSKIGAVIGLVFLGLAFLSINLVGPWVVSVIGRIAARTARRPARLLAARRLVDDPRSAWRTVSGIALTGFVAGFLSLLTPSASLLGSHSANRLELDLPHKGASSLVHTVEQRLPGLHVTTSDGRLTVTVPGGTAVVDRARTAMAGLSPGHVATAPADDDVQAVTMLRDLRTGSLVVLIVSFLLAITSAGITGASSVLDRRQAYGLLWLAGTPLEVLDSARRQETVIPLAVMGGGSLLTGLFFATPFAIGFGISGAFTLVAFVVLGVVGIVGASALSRPLLRAVVANPSPRPD
jgi:hypothetical protein